MATDAELLTAFNEGVGDPVTPPAASDQDLTDAFNQGSREFTTQAIKLQKKPTTTEILRKRFRVKFKEAQEAEAKRPPVRPEDRLLSAVTASIGRPPEFAENFLNSIEAGLEMSSSGLLATGMPDTITPQNAGMANRIAGSVAGIVGDIPAIVAGFIGGGAAGSEVPLVGNVIGAGAGAFALPAFIRTSYMQSIGKGEVTSFSDFWERLSTVFIETGKGAVIGGATAGVGGVVGKVVAPAAVSATTKSAAVIGSEVATLTTIGSALEGQLPEPEHFIEALATIGILKAAAVPISREFGRRREIRLNKRAKLTQQKLFDIYSKTGIDPRQVANDAFNDPVLKQELLSSNVEIPTKYRNEQGITNVFETPARTEIRADASLIKKNNILQDQAGSISVEPLKLTELEKSKLSPEERIIGEKIVVDEKVTMNFSKAEAVEAFMDDLHPIRRAVEIATGGKLRDAPKGNIYVSMRNSRGSYGVVTAWMDQAQIGAKGEAIGKPFTKIVKPIEKSGDRFDIYALSRRVLEREKAGFKTGFDLQAAAKVVKKGDKEFAKVFKELEELQNNVLKTVKNSGLLSEKEFQIVLEKSKDFVPMYRSTTGRIQGGVGPSGGGVRNPIKRFKGSEKDVISPLISISKNMQNHLMMSERNVLLQQLTRELPDFVVEKKAGPRSLAENEIAVFFEGKRKVFELEDSIVAAVKSLDRESVNGIVKLISIPAKLQRAGITLSPEFIARNIIRDQVTSVAFSENGALPVITAVQGMFHLVRGKAGKFDQVYFDWLRNGGAQATMVSIDRNYIRQDVMKLAKQTGFLDKTWNVLRTPLEMARTASELAENATRLGEFKLARAKAKSPADLRDAAFQSRNITLDFQRIGAKTQALNKMATFHNAHVGGLLRFKEAITDNPKGVSARLGLMVTLPSVLVWWANKDDQRIKDIPDYQKDLFWPIATDETIYRIPKPFEQGVIFGSLVERLLDAFFTDNPEAFVDFEKTVISTLIPPFVPTLGVTVHEHIANKSTFTGAPIIPFYLEKVSPEYQHVTYTSETAKLIGGILDKMVDRHGRFKDLASPIVLEHYVKSWTGNIGKLMLQAADAALIATGAVPDPIKPTSTLADIPMVRAFIVRHPTSNTKPMEKFFEQYKKNRQTIDNIRHNAQLGDVVALQKEIDLGISEGTISQLDGIKNAIGNMNRLMQRVNQNKEMPPDEKRQQLDKLMTMMTEIAREGLKAAKAQEKALKATRGR